MKKITLIEASQLDLFIGTCFAHINQTFKFNKSSKSIMDNLKNKNGQNE